jgi:vacuolar-type H+-ATPase subunit I/STV1
MIKIDFDKFNEAGLKDILKQFGKADLPVEKVDATNKAKREMGFLVKSATFNFESGQKLLLKAKAGGSIFQVRLNGKVIPIKNADDLEKGVKEVVQYVKKNEVTYLKQRAKRIEALQKVKIKLPKNKTGSVSIERQIESYNSSLDQLKISNDAIGGQIEEANNVAINYQSKIEALNKELSQILDSIELLRSQINKYKEAA